MLMYCIHVDVGSNVFDNNHTCSNMHIAIMVTYKVVCILIEHLRTCM